MPHLPIYKDRFDELMGQKYTFSQLEQIGFQFGIEVQQAVELIEQIEKPLYKFDCMNNRPDLLTETTLVRTFKIYLERIPTPELKLTKPQLSITIDPSVKAIRPFIVGAVLRNITFTKQTYRAFIAAQTKLHKTFCRQRKYASIGTHDLDTIQGPLKYVAKEPTKFKFVPLNQNTQMNGLEMMAELQTNQNHLKEYLHLIKNSPVYPLVLDGQDRILSVPPIINSEHSKMSINTRNVLIEITALSRSKAMTCLNTLVWSFSEYCQTPFEVEPVEIIYGEEKFLTPQIDKKQFIVRHEKAEIMVGAKLTSEQIVRYLKKSGLKAIPIQNDSYRVLVPCWRADVIHECDILEDIAICYGYKNVVPVFPPSATVGSRLRLNKFTDLLRQQMAQSQFNEVLNFALCSRADMTSNVFNNDESKLIRIENAKTKEFQTGRTTLLPGLLRTIIENKSSPLPFKLFEAGDCIIMDPESDTGSSNVSKLAAIMTDEITEGHKKDIFPVIHGALDLVMKKCSFEFKRDYVLKPGNNPFFFAGQQFEVILKGEKVGEMGVVNPKVLKNFNWLNPTSMWELDIAILEKHFTAKFS